VYRVGWGKEKEKAAAPLPLPQFLGNKKNLGKISFNA